MLQDNCQNYVRILAVMSPGKLLVCGTNSFKPICREYSVQVRYFILFFTMGITFMCPNFYYLNFNFHILYLYFSYFKFFNVQFCMPYWLSYRPVSLLNGTEKCCSRSWFETDDLWLCNWRYSSNAVDHSSLSKPMVTLFSYKIYQLRCQFWIVQVVQL